jgi:hypothetical protein
MDARLLAFHGAFWPNTRRGADTAAGSVGYWVALVLLAVLIAPDALFFTGRALARAIRRLLPN